VSERDALLDWDEFYRWTVKNPMSERDILLTALRDIVATYDDNVDCELVGESWVCHTSILHSEIETARRVIAECDATDRETSE
jgi:hypothetical protein